MEAAIPAPDATARATQLARSLFECISSPPNFTKDQVIFRKRILNLLAEQGPLQMTRAELDGVLNFRSAEPTDYYVVRDVTATREALRHALSGSPDIFHSSNVDTIQAFLASFPGSNKFLFGEPLTALLSLDSARLEAILDLFGSLARHFTSKTPQGMEWANWIIPLSVEHIRVVEELAGDSEKAAFILNDALYFRLQTMHAIRELNIAPFRSVLERSITSGNIPELDFHQISHLNGGPEAKLNEEGAVVEVL